MMNWGDVIANEVKQSSHYSAVIARYEAISLVSRHCERSEAISTLHRCHYSLSSRDVISCCISLIPLL